MILKLRKKMRDGASLGHIAFFIGLFLNLFWLITPIQPSGAAPLKQLTNGVTKEKKAEHLPIESRDTVERFRLAGRELSEQPSD